MPESNAIENFESIPEWVTKDYVLSALQDYKNDKSIKLTRIDIIPTGGKGENYASDLYKVDVEFVSDTEKKPQSRKLLLKKSFHDDEFASEKIGHYGIYEREMDIYETVFPKLRKILAKIGYNQNIVPKTAKIDFDHETILFDDLTAKSFVMADRTDGLDLVHTKLILEKVAKLQAASAVLNEMEPHKLNRLDKGMFNRYTEAFSPLYVDCIEICGKMVSKWEGFEEYGKKLLKLKPFVMEYGKRVFDVEDNLFCTLVHGDLWTNNAMFKYNDKNEPIDVIIIDFQFSCWGSPTIDLHYFFNTSLKEELRLYHQDELVHFYYNHLTNTLRDLKFKGKIPSLKEFWIQFMEKSFYAFISGCLVQPIHINDQPDDADFAALMKSDERALRFKQAVFNNKKVHKNLRNLLPMFDRKGLLDVVP